MNPLELSDIKSFTVCRWPPPKSLQICLETKLFVQQHNLKLWSGNSNTDIKPHIECHSSSLTCWFDRPQRGIDRYCSAVCNIKVLRKPFESLEVWTLSYISNLCCSLVVTEEKTVWVQTFSPHTFQTTEYFYACVSPLFCGPLHVHNKDLLFTFM